MSDIKYFENLLSEIDELKNTHKSVSITGRPIIAQQQMDIGLPQNPFSLKDLEKEAPVASKVLQKLKSVLPEKLLNKAADLLKKVPVQSLEKALPLSSRAILPFLARATGWGAIASLAAEAGFSVAEYAQENEQEKSRKALTSDPAMFIAKLFQANQKSLSAEKSLELVERFNENLKFFLNSDSFEKGRSENERMQAAQLAALNSVAKRENLKPLLQLPQTIQQKTMEDAAKQLGQKMDQSKTQTPQSQPTSSYVVQKGDTLFSIAQKMYGDGKFWTLLFQANPNLIKNPDMIQVGWNLAVPAKTQTPPPAPRIQPKTQTQRQVQQPPQAQQVQQVQQVQQPPQAQQVQQVQQPPQQVQQVPQKPTKVLVEEYAYAPNEQSKDEKMQQLVQNMYAVARSGSVDRYLEHLRTFPIDPKTADQHGYQILKETLTDHSGMATLANSYLKTIRNKSFAELDRDYDSLSSLNAIFSRAGMDNEAKWAQYILRLVDKARDAK